MRMIVFFDLPVQTKTERRHATAFRNFLLKDGYHMLQFSVYARVCNGNDAVKKHESRLRASLQTAQFACLSLQKSSTSLFRFFWEIISRKKPLLYVNS